MILLIDKYDVPVAKANSNGYYEEMLDVMKGLMQALKDNQALCFAVITGCLKIAKESIKEWYDGYHFGDFDVYCPWDVMNYLLQLQYNPKAKPVSYWKNTSDNAVIRSFIDYAGGNITGKLKTLLAGGIIVQRVDESLTYDYLHSSENNLWSMLYLTGYLTKARKEDYDGKLSDDTMALMIPNAEIKEIFETTVIKWFDDSTKKCNWRALFDAVWNGDSEKLTKEMNTSILENQKGI